MNLNYIQEYRDGDLAKKLASGINAALTGPIRLMEVCGTHTMAIFRHGIRSVLPGDVTLLTGPGCPVCVTSQRDIDMFVELAMDENRIVTTFGDLMRVPGTTSSLRGEKAKGRDVRIVYSVFDAIETAAANPDREVVFCAVGFETTTPASAVAGADAHKLGLDNFLLSS